MAELPADADAPALARILERRMAPDRLAVPLAAVIEGVRGRGVAVLYHERDRDLRSVLKLAHAAAAHGVDRGATAIAPRDVRDVVARSAR